MSGATCSATVAEASHRLMMIEAVTRGLVESGNVARKLRERPDIVRQLHVYQAQVDRIPAMGVDILPVDAAILTAAGELRRRYGLLTNDSIAAAAAAAAGIRVLASADRDFDTIADFTVHRPADIR